MGVSRAPTSDLALRTHAPPVGRIKCGDGCASLADAHGGDAARVRRWTADRRPLARVGRTAAASARPYQSPHLGARLPPVDDRPGARRQRCRLAFRSNLARRALARHRRRGDARVVDHALRPDARPRPTHYGRTLTSNPTTETRVSNEASPSARRAHWRARAGSRGTPASSDPPGTSCLL